MKIKTVLLALTLAACGHTMEGDDIPPIGNLWHIEDPTGCVEREAFQTVALAICGNFGQRPVTLGYGSECLAWFVGIAGPYAVPGVHSITFTCW